MFTDKKLKNKEMILKKLQNQLFLVKIFL